MSTLLMAGCGWLLADPVEVAEPEPEPTIDSLLPLCSYEGRREPDRPACLKLGTMLIAAGRQPEAIQPLFYACNGRLYDACIELGLLHLRGDGVPANYDEALARFSQASGRSGVAGGWYSYARLAEEPKSPMARNARDSSMHFDCTYSTTGWPCYNYGVLLACGYFGDVDVPHALSAFHRGCFLADPRACDLAGKLQTGTTRLPCDLVGPDPKNPVELTLKLDPPDPSETWPEGEERFERTPLPVGR